MRFANTPKAHAFASPEKPVVESCVASHAAYPSQRYRSVRGRFAFVAAVAIFTATSAKFSLAQEPGVRADQIVQSYVDANHFMGSVLVAKDGTIILDKGYGFANLEWQIPNSAGTKFRLGSITKQFTAASILLLEDRGKLKTDDLVKNYLPDAPATWDKITIYNLLTHTSGIPDFTGFPDYTTSKGMPITPAKLVAKFRDKPLDFQPGEKFQYSNSGYVLLGYLVEKISGLSFQEFVQENIFKPLTMANSGYDSHAAILPHRASGYTSGPNGPANADYIDMSVPFAAGGLYSTTGDLLRWEQGLFGGNVLSNASLRKMITPFKGGYACGLTVNEVNGHSMIEHSGDIDGFDTDLAFYPDDKLTIVVLSNINGSSPRQITGKIASVIHGEKVTLLSDLKEVQVSREILGKYVGTYQLAPNFNIVISLEGGRLMAEGSGQPKYPLFAESETRFFVKDLDAPEIEFTRNQKGEATSLTIHQGGRDMPGPRK
jgi:CubicO group peptidase (beta-lactamase class C family)